MGRSRSTATRCARTMSPVAVIGFKIDASEYIVCSVATVRFPVRPSESLFPDDAYVLRHRDGDRGDPVFHQAPRPVTRRPRG